MSKDSGFLRWTLLLVKMLVKNYWNDNKVHTYYISLANILVVGSETINPNWKKFYCEQNVIKRTLHAYRKINNDTKSQVIQQTLFLF